MTRNFNDLLNIDGIGETQVSSIKNFFANELNVKVLDELGKILSIQSLIGLSSSMFTPPDQRLLVQLLKIFMPIRDVFAKLYRALRLILC